MDNEIVVSGLGLIETAQENQILSMGVTMSKFSSELKNLLIDGIDYGMIPKVDKPCLFKSGGEKIQLVLGLTPQYTLTDKRCVPSVFGEGGTLTENGFYLYEFMCSLYHNGVKVAEGVGTANTRERKYRSQAQKGIYSEDLCNTVMKIAKKRAFMDAIIAVAGISDMFTQDLEDNEKVREAKVDKKTGVGKISVEDARVLGTEAWVKGISVEETVKIYQKVNPKYKKSTDIDKKDFAQVLSLIRAYKKGE